MAKVLVSKEHELPKGFFKEYMKILNRGLSDGMGNRGEHSGKPGKVCIEAAVCWALGEDHTDNPKCVSPTIRLFGIELNDSMYVNDKVRAKGLRDFGIAQLGSKGTVNAREFRRVMKEKIIREIIPVLAMEKELSGYSLITEGAKIAAQQGHLRGFGTSRSFKYYHTKDPYSAFLNLLYCVNRLTATTYPQRLIGFVSTLNNSLWAIKARGQFVDNSKQAREKYFYLLTKITVDTLKELNSPGCKYLSKVN